MLRVALLFLGAWFTVGLAVALAVGRAGRRSGLESVAQLQLPLTVAAPVPHPDVDELAARRARRASIAVRVAAAAAAIGILGAVGSARGVASFGQEPASNVVEPAVVGEERAPAADRRPVVAVERWHETERLSSPGHAHDVDAPGHDPAGPGRSEDAPGHDPAGPGRSEDAPGHDPAGPGRSEVAPGSESPAADDAGAAPRARSDEASGRAQEDAPGRSDEASGASDQHRGEPPR